MRPDKKEDYRAEWEAKRQEFDAMADKLDAEKRMEYHNAMEDFSAEIEAGADWVRADWEQFIARVNKWWNQSKIAAARIKK